ncbi:M23 family metallopeptidase [Sphaerisporangium sp. TRM90804]|uniref:M23 family metallopeptidase n=1 Tax=Sphaerisporangium sp. TRM90804 TaxID=3031113 RepID=UPI00244B1DE4|nr:M23 family metallopeptidase [Sphaerisporangium sp. TRM90804]MDH2426116.1 M23 family metallopeptidase [Sphaerisporangium sp. TRM90804]
MRQYDETSLRKLAMIVYRGCWFAFFVVVAGGFVFGYGALWGWVPLGVAIALQLWLNRKPAPGAGAGAGDAEAEALEVGPPVTGRWSALNSPADKVPSHGTRAYGQAYAIDIVAEPEDRPRPRFGWWPLARRNGDFPAFGAPVLAVADATVVRVVDRYRDHLSRNSWPALLYLIVEGLFRDMGGPGRIVGNHVVLDLGGGVHALYAHLRRGSITVREGERVRAGQTLASCGDSGNSSEPHVHFQLMDGPDLDTAHGLPFRWRGVGVPANGEVFSAEEPTRA